MDIALQRLNNLGLINSKFKTPLDAISHLGAVQAQEYDNGKWAFGLRIPNSTDEDIEKSIKNKEIVRTWPMRGTLHFVAARDAKWMVKLLAPRVIRKMNSYYKKADLSEKNFLKAKDILVPALKGRKQLTRPEIYKIWEEQNIKTQNQRGLFILQYLSSEGLLCFGDKIGKQQTFVLMDEWIIDSINLENEQAVAELAKRYFTSHGPATVADFAWWSGLTRKEIVEGLEHLDLQKEKIGDREFYFDKKIELKQSNNIFFLGAYDEYTVSYKDRTDIADTSNTFDLYTRNGFYSIIVSEGKVAGTWRKDIVKDKIIIQANALKHLDDSKLLEAAQNYGKFFRKEVELQMVK